MVICELCPHHLTPIVIRHRGEGHSHSLPSRLLQGQAPVHSQDTALLSSSMGMCLMLPHNPTTTSSTSSCLPKEPFPQTFYIPPDRHEKQLAMLTSWKPKEENSHHCFSRLLSPASHSPSGIWTLGTDVKNLMWLQEEGRI